MQTQIETIIIGGGQAGLGASYYLNQLRHENLVLESASQPGNAWRNGRWDSFTLVTPNWSFRLPGAWYEDHDPDGYMPRDEIVETFENYITRFHLPVQYSAPVTAVEPLDGRGYLVRTPDQEYAARNVVVATGLYQNPKFPAYASDLSPAINQLHSGEYRNPGALPPGAVLVVGSAQSGCQIAEELYQSGRTVYLCTCSAGRAPRRYRGKDMYEWLHLSGFLDHPVDQLPSPRAKFAGNPHLSGRDGGHNLNLHQFARDGVILLGRAQDGAGNTIYLAPGMHQNLASADKVEYELLQLVDGYIARSGLDLPEETLPALRDGFHLPQPGELDIKSAGVTSIIWALGYTYDFSLVRLPVCDDDGFPIQTRGVSTFPGLYFVGMPWIHTRKSGHLVGFGEDAECIAGHIAAR
jgi:putative flavoprotein involved in K+ transport